MDKNSKNSQAQIQYQNTFDPFDRTSYLENAMLGEDGGSEEAGSPFNFSIANIMQFRDPNRIDFLTANPPFVVTKNCTAETSPMKPNPEQYAEYCIRALGNHQFTFGPPLQNMYGYVSLWLGNIFIDCKFMYALIVKFIKEKSVFHPKSNALHTI